MTINATIVRDAEEFVAWIDRAGHGEWCEYARGNLPDNQEVVSYVRDAYLHHEAAPFQERAGDGVFRYLAVRVVSFPEFRHLFPSPRETEQLLKEHRPIEEMKKGRGYRSRKVEK